MISRFFCDICRTPLIIVVDSTTAVRQSGSVESENRMNTDERIEIANRLRTAIESGPAKEKANVWQKHSMIRVYLRKGYAVITDDGSVDVRAVAGHAFQRGIATRAESAGLSVVGI